MTEGTDHHICECCHLVTAAVEAAWCPFCEMGPLCEECIDTLEHGCDGATDDEPMGNAGFYPVDDDEDDLEDW